MAATVTVVSNVDATLNRFLVEGTIVLSGNYGAVSPANGDILSFAAFDQIKSTSVPTRVEIYEEPPAGTAPTGYLFGFSPGTTIALGKLTVFNNVTQFTQGDPYSAGLLAAVIKFRAEFPAFI